MSRFLSTNVAPKSSKASILSCLDTKSALAIRYSTMCIWPVTAAASKGVMPGNITKVFYLGQIRHIEKKVFWKSYLWRKKTRPSICIQVKVSRLNYCSGHLKVNLIKQSSAHYSKSPYFVQNSFRRKSNIYESKIWFFTKKCGKIREITSAKHYLAIDNVDFTRKMVEIILKKIIDIFLDKSWAFNIVCSNSRAKIDKMLCPEFLRLKIGSRVLFYVP